MKTHSKFAFLLSFCTLFLSMPQVLADEIQNLKVTASDNQVNIVWDPASQEILSKTEGYAVQWSIYQNNIRNDKYARKFLNQNNLVLRKGSFETNQAYYFRVYTYVSEGRSKVLGNGSKILKWTLKSDGEVEEVYMEANDPVIATTTSSSSSSTTQKFGTIRVSRFDNFSDISWSKPTKLTAKEYDGFSFEVSKKISMEDPVLSFETSKTIYKARIKNLDANTQYYVRGYFYKEKAGDVVKFGEGTVKPFKTIASIDRTVSSRASRNIARIEKKSYFTATVGGTATTTTTTTTTSTSSTSTGTSTPTVTKASSTTEIRTKIAELKKEIKALQASLRSWNKQLRDKLKAQRSTN